VNDSALRDAADQSAVEFSDSTPRAFSVAASANYRSWFGVTTEVSGVFWTDESHDLIQRWTIQAGPTFRAAGRIARPFGQLLVGTAYSRGGIPDAGVDFEGWDFALQPGGGIDVALSPHIGLRAGVDALVLWDKFLSGDTRHQVRFTLGVTFFHGSF